MEFNKVYWQLDFYRELVPIFDINMNIIEHAKSDIMAK